MNANIERFQVNNSPEQHESELNVKQSKDEVDFSRMDSYPTLKSHTIKSDSDYNNKLGIVNNQCSLLAKKLTPGTLYGDCEVKTSIKSSLSTLEKLAVFNLYKKKSESIHNSTKERNKFVKVTTLARILGNTYNTKKTESELMQINNDDDCSTSNIVATGSKTTSIKNVTNQMNCVKKFSSNGRFQKYSNLDDNVNEVYLHDFRDDRDLSAKAFRTISRSLGKLWWKRTHSIDISAPDPEYKVSYLGNVLTGWAKGEGCIEKPLNTLWRNYTQNHKPDVVMRIRICASGLKATTRQHGLTEYWANRITYCCAPKNYPKVFCWIYRHEGRKLKHELRCHAVLCSKESAAQDICTTLRENLDRALKEFKREKISRQNARLSLANAVYENPSLPRRKILLSVGGNNYKPPLERSKSAPKLMAIEEAIGEEGEDNEDINELKMPPCCQKDSLYPAMTLGRRHCRKGHSIRRTGKVSSKTSCTILPQNVYTTKELSQGQQTDYNKELTKAPDEDEYTKTKSTSSLISDDDDFEKFLSHHNYDTNSPLSNELLSYFDMKIKPKTSSLTNLNDETIIFEPLLSSDSKPRLRSTMSLDNLDDGINRNENCTNRSEYDELDDTDNVFYQQSSILNLLYTDSLRKISNLSMNSDDNSIETIKTDEIPSSVLCLKQIQQNIDSDEGSISSGCETASTVTTNIDDSSLKYIPMQQHNQEHKKQLQNELNQNIHMNSSNQQNLLNNDDINQRHFNNDEIKICSATINFTLPRQNSSIRFPKGKNITNNLIISTTNNNNKGEGDDISDSEFSDESGYVEFQEQNILKGNKIVRV